MNRPAAEGTRDAAIARVLWWILAANVAVAATKIAYGMISGSLGIRADGFHSLLDGVNNVVALVIARLAARPPDADHPYGHRKFEVLGSLAIGGFILLLLLRLIGEAITALVEGTSTLVGIEAFAIMIGTLVINLGVTVSEHRAGKRLDSPLLIADARHTLSDVFVTIAVIGGLAGTRFGYARADAIAALLVMALVAWVAFGVVRHAVPVLSDKVAIPAEQIGSIAARVDGVSAVQRVRSRGGAGDVRVDMIVEVAGSLSVAEAHAIADRVEEAVQSRWSEVSEVVVHVEPKKT